MTPAEANWSGPVQDAIREHYVEFEARLTSVVDADDPPFGLLDRFAARLHVAWLRGEQ